MIQRYHEQDKLVPCLNMETYNGLVRTPTDAIILFEACRLGLLPRVQRRLSEKERQSIRSGSVFVWDEREAGMRRWTDGKSWSASRVSGSFLTYREMEGKRGNNFGGSNTNSHANSTSRGTKTPDSGGGGDDDIMTAADGEEGPDGYRYKPDGLMKQSFSITTSAGQHLHLISYYSRLHPNAQSLRQPSTDPSLASIVPAKGMYPESTVNDQATVPAVTRSPMLGAPNYVMVPQPMYGARPGPIPPHSYIPTSYIPHPAYVYPVSPMHTPPAHYALQPYPPVHPGLPPLGYPPNPYGQPPPAAAYAQIPPPLYDQRPSRPSDSQPLGPPPPALSVSAPPSIPIYMPGQHPAQITAPYTTTHSQSKEPLPPPSELAADKSNTSLQSTPQIDPRLTLDGPQTSLTVSPRGEGSHSRDRSSEPLTSTASQIPNIGALVHSTNIGMAGDRSSNDKITERKRSRSPGGTKLTASIQDIPSEKLGFREDKRALSKLDRVFARA